MKDTQPNRGPGCDFSGENRSGDKGREKRMARLSGKVVSSAALGLLLAIRPAPVLAQSAEGQAAASGEARQAPDISEIVVTARRREESLEKVPIAITALSGEALENKSIHDVFALQTQVPGLTVVNNTSDKSLINFNIRGQQSFFGSPNDAVITYFADIPTSAVGRALFYDLQNVQVLKGPQGTLFGRNTTGGAVLFEPARPEKDAKAAFSLRLGNYDKKESDGFVNMPLGSTLAARLAYAVGDTRGFVHDLTTGKKLEGEKFWAMRLGLLWEPSASITNYLVGSYYKERSTGGASFIFAVRPNLTAPDGTVIANGLAATLNPLLAAQRARGPYVIANTPPDPRTNIDNITLTNITTARLSDAVTLKNIAGYRLVKLVRTIDTDGTALSLIQNDPLNDHQEQFSEEFQIQANLGRMDLIAGAFYLKNKPTNLDPFRANNSQVFGNVTQRPNYFTITSKALFAQGGYEIVDGLKLNAGLRYTWDTVRNDAGQFVVNAASGAITCSAPFTNPSAFCIRTLTTKNKKLTWLVGADYTISPRTLAYITARRGYRTGATNGFAPAGAPLTYAPEVVDDVELGLKTNVDLGTMPVRMNIAAFRSKYKDAQRIVVVPVGTQLSTVVLNAASAVIKGLEAELTVRPAPGLTLGGYYALTDGKYNSFFNFEYGRDISDIDFVYTPRHKFGLSAAVEQPLNGIGTFAANFDYSWQSRQHAANKPDADLVLNPLTNRYVVGEPAAEIPSYGLLNGRIGVREVRGLNLDVSVFATNLTNKAYLRGLIGTTYSAAGFNSVTPGTPRTYGVEAKVRF